MRTPGQNVVELMEADMCVDGQFVDKELKVTRMFLGKTGL